MLVLTHIGQALNVGVETNPKHVNPIYTFKYKENVYQVGLPGAHSVNQSLGKTTQMTLEQHRFELYGSTYMWIVFNNILKHFWRFPYYHEAILSITLGYHKTIILMLLCYQFMYHYTCK